MSVASLSCSLRALSIGSQRPAKVSLPSSSTPSLLLHSSLAARRNGLCGAQLVASRRCSTQVQRIETVGPVCKLKTRKAAAKRYKVTGTGKVLTRRPGKQHINEKKSPKRLSQLGKLKQIDHGDLIKVKKCLPNANIK
ncbi:probable 50S ribosomal protein L35 at C-terminar half [Coccomyxa sp. Obi]|nr:probable 50S ribosomal protein L35 at C-terminar half [Coccomyxa sp. Obi]